MLSQEHNDTTETLKLSDNPSADEYAAAFAHMRRDGTYSPSKGGDGGRGDGGKKRPAKSESKPFTGQVGGLVSEGEPSANAVQGNAKVALSKSNPADVQVAAGLKEGDVIEVDGGKWAVQKVRVQKRTFSYPIDDREIDSPEETHEYQITTVSAINNAWNESTFTFGGQQQAIAEFKKTYVPRNYKEAATLTVTKQANGVHRWVAVSSSAYRDRDGEIVSTKALEDDCARADTDGNYGPLRWWHVKGLDIGTCDFNAMHGRMLVESGTFYDERVATAIKEHAHELAVSIGFNHARNEPDADGVFNRIQRFERSFLPRNRESNLFTTLGAVMKEVTMTKDKEEVFTELVGPDVAKDLITKADTTQKQADADAVAFKQFPPDTKDDEECADDDKDCEDKKTPPKFEKKATRTKAATVGNMSVDDFALAIGTAFQAIVAPVLESQKAAKVEPMPNAEIEALKAELAELRGDMPKFAQKSTSVTADDSVLAEMLKAYLGAETTKSQPSENDRLVENQMRALRATK